jgi:hypothetical protein
MHFFFHLVAFPQKRSVFHLVAFPQKRSDIMEDAGVLSSKRASVCQVEGQAGNANCLASSTWLVFSPNHIDTMEDAVADAAAVAAMLCDILLKVCCPC